MTVRDNVIILNMRNRHLSPQTAIFSSSNSLLSPSHRLKMAGSTSKLRNYHSTLLCDSQRKIGSYSYSTSQQIGSGYSSKVYRGHSSRDGSQVAIKVIELKKYSDQSLRMLDSQIEILKTLEHPNVIKCYDIYKTQTHCYIITELCQGGDLLNYLTRRGKLDESVTVSIMQEIVEGVQYLLSRGILHRDLKPANIINNKQNWKIADFGFAIYSDKEIKTKYNVGTPLYMPPEALVKNVYSPASDIFSVGVIFYELLTGITPWECKNEKQLIKKMNSLPYCLSERYRVSGEVRTLLESMCAKSVDKRLGKEEFMNLKVKKEDEELKLESKGSSKLVLEKSHSEVCVSQDLLKKSNSNIHLYSAKSLLSDKNIDPVPQKVLDSKIQTRNNHILISQLHYCRFIYYFLRNISHLIVSDKAKSKLMLIMYKHLQKLIKQLADGKQNWFKLKNWDMFKVSKKYYGSQLTMKEYADRYEKQYLAFLKKTELDVVRDINKNFNELSTPESFSSGLYRKMMTAVGTILRQANHNTTLKVNSAQQGLTSQLRGNIEAIQSLHKYYKLLEMALQDYEDFDAFEKKSSVKVQIDYKNSQGANLETFRQLRQALKFI